jgi:DNA polymerase-1
LPVSENTKELPKSSGRFIVDVEANGLDPTEIHVVVSKDVDTGEVYVHRSRSDFHGFSQRIRHWIGHNFLAYDIRALKKVWAIDIVWTDCLDTLVLSRLFDATLADHKKPHSIEAWGQRLGVKKVGADISDWSVWTQEMEDRCKSDVEINYLLFKRFEKFIVSERWQKAIETEHFIANFCQILSKNGFKFNFKESITLKNTIEEEVKSIEEELKRCFPPKYTLIREVLPRLTKHGTIALNSIPKVLGSDFSPYSADAPFSLIEAVPFNGASHTQRIERLWEAGWSPEVKSKSHADAAKALRKLQRLRRPTPAQKAERAALEGKMGEYGISGFARTGWKTTDEENLKTLPDDAPPQFKKLARFITLKNRISTLESWIKVCDPITERIHGSFNHIGAWTHRMSHDRPNMGNIPKFDAKQPEKTPYSDRMRSLWVGGEGRYLVGVDAESIQLRIFGHYINDKGFIDALISGRKEDATDPHSLNQKALGVVCRSRDDAKTFIYAWLLGAGIAKVAAILGCSRDEAQEANDNFLDFYPGLKFLKENVIPADALRGWFEGFDGRAVKIWGDDVDSRRHFTLAGYLQNGESVIMKRATQLWYPKLVKEGIPIWPVNFVHDEWQIETVRDMEVAKYVAETVADSIRTVGLDLGLRCPFAGSVLNGHGKLAIGDNWMDTH